MDFPENLYVVAKNGEEFSTDKSPLALATPHSKDKKFQTRKENADCWANLKKGQEGKIIKNEFVEGFIFKESVSRSETDNKWFEVKDPRGFSLQISAFNLEDILINEGIVKRQFQGSFIWGRKGSTNFLTRQNHPEYIKSISPKHEIQLGDKIKIQDWSKSELTYVGDYYAIIINKEIPYGNSIAYYTHELDSKPYKLLWSGDDHEVKFMRSFPKNFDYIGKGDIKDFDGEQIYHFEDTRIYFKNKEDMEKFEMKDCDKIWNKARTRRMGYQA